MQHSDDLEEAFEKSSLSTSKKGSLFKKKEIKGLKSQRKVTSVDLDGHDEVSQEEAAPVKKRTKFNRADNRNAKTSLNFKHNLFAKAKFGATDESVQNKEQFDQPEEKLDGIDIIDGANIGVLNDSVFDNKDEPKKNIDKRQQYFPANDYLEFGDEDDDVQPAEIVEEDAFSPVGINLAKRAIDSDMYDNEVEVDSGISSDQEAELQSNRVKYTLKMPTDFSQHVHNLQHSLDHLRSSIERQQLERRELMDDLDRTRMKKQDVLNELASGVK